MQRRALIDLKQSFKPNDAIKKALSYFSIGNRAYQGLLKGEMKQSFIPNAPQPNRTEQPVDLKQSFKPNGKKPAPYKHEPEVKALKNAVAKAGLAHDTNGWLTWKCSVLQAVVADNDLTLEHIAKLKLAVEAQEKADAA